MNTELLFLKDSYKREFEAEVLNFEKNYVVLDRTCFYPKGGGQDCDTGTLGDFTVSKVKKKKGKVLHKIDGTPEEGDTVTGKLDWERRYSLMKYHTALHILSRAVFNRYGGAVAGNQIHPHKARIDFDLEEIKDEKEIEEKTNEIIKEGRPVKTFTVPREKAAELVDEKTRLDLIPDFIKDIRVIDIEGYDIDACGGTHVKNTEEIGEIEITNVESKGKRRKRVTIV
ncbi:MAG: alanyl-tRNA editing protein [Euryarchaeota archaeon]|nr:alanyl-tRNA editing protein [Euryarchaeota archaeon]